MRGDHLTRNYSKIVPAPCSFQVLKKQSCKKSAPGDKIFASSGGGICQGFQVRPGLLRVDEVSGERRKPTPIIDACMKQLLPAPCLAAF